MTTVAKFAAFVIFIGAIAGATLAVREELGGSDAALAVAVRGEAAHAKLNATAGHDVTFPVTINNRGDKALDVVARLSGDALAGAAPIARVPAGSSSTVFVTLSVPVTQATGVYDLDLRLETLEGALLRHRDSATQLAVISGGPGFGDDTTASLYYVGRLTTSGKVFNTNDPAILSQNFPKADIYSPSEGELELQGGPNAGVVEGFYNALLGMQAGESRTVVIPAALAYGNATTDENIPRAEPIERNFYLPAQPETVARATFDKCLADGKDCTSNGTTPGSVFYFKQGANNWPYRIDAINDQFVEYSLVVEPGQKFTLYPFWVNGSEVVSVNETQIHFVTTPTGAEGEGFTSRPYWPGLTRVANLTNETIVIEHDLAVGFKYTQPATANQPAKDYTVKSVEGDTIVVSTPSGSPLAGQDLTFDIFVTRIST